MAHGSSTPVADAASLRTQPIAASLARVEAAVRAQPAAAAHRWALFQLLCVAGQWARALQQLQAVAQLDPSRTGAVQAYRDLVRAERRRGRVMAGQAQPGFVFDAPDWAGDLLAALRASAAGAHDDADRLRERAFDRAPLVAARTPRAHVDWIADSDTRLGPVCEIVTAGHYRWLPFEDLLGWRIARPTVLLDLVWAPCTLKLVDGASLHGFMPARYSGSDGADVDEHGATPDTDALRVGRRTIWRESGRTGIIALGGKTWTTSIGDVGLFELEQCVFGEAAGEPDAEPSGDKHESA